MAEPGYCFSIAAFVKSVREEQKKMGRSLSGCSKLAPETVAIIDKTVQKFCDAVDTQGLSRENCTLLLKRFAELCRRQKTPIPAFAFPGVLQHLVLEVGINATLLQENPNKLISTTIYNGAVAQTLIQKFAHLSKALFRHAVAKNPANPILFVERYEATLAHLKQICADPTHPLHCFFKMLWILKHVAVHNLSRPVEGLFAVKKRIDSCLVKCNDPKNKLHRLVGQPGIVTYAAIHHPKEMERFLLGYLARARPPMRIQIDKVGGIVENLSSSLDRFGEALARASNALVAKKPGGYHF